MGRRKSKVCAPRGEESTEVFRTEVDFEQVLYRLALHAQSLFTAAACLERAQVVLPGGDCAADLGQHHVGTCKAVKMRGELQVVGRSEDLPLLPCPFHRQFFLT